MIKSGTDKGCGIVANETVLCRWQVGRGLAGCRYAVMTGCAVVNDTLMIEHRRIETTACNMTDSAVFRCRYVWRISLGSRAGRIGAVVTGVAAQRHDFGTAVIHKCIEEARRVMTGRAVTAGIVMDRGIRLAAGADRNISRTAVVTGNAVIGNTGMAER